MIIPDITCCSPRNFLFLFLGFQQHRRQNACTSACLRAIRAYQAFYIDFNVKKNAQIRAYRALGATKKGPELF